MPVTPALRRDKQEDHKFKVILSYLSVEGWTGLRTTSSQKETRKKRLCKHPGGVHGAPPLATRGHTLSNWAIEVILRLVRPHDLNISYVEKVVVKLSSSFLFFINFL